MNENNLELYKYITAGNDLLSRAKRCFSNAASEKVKMLTNKIPQEMSSQGKRVNLVFAGQYSAGKSSILKALTGREDIAVGAGITTQEMHVYDWNGINIIDTPGVHTELRPDHDKITYKAIADADLLVFVITNELFDSHLAEHFRKLAIEQGKAHEMMLVVNKMQRCAKGNSVDSQNVIREDLKKVLAPFTPEELHITFIDAAYAIESKKEKDDRAAKSFFKKSGFSQFIEEMNKFIKEKRLTSQYTTTLYQLKEVLLEAISSESTGDTEADVSKSSLLQVRQELSETRSDITQRTKAVIQSAVSKIRSEGKEIAEKIHGEFDNEAINFELEEAQNRVQNIVNNLEEDIQKIIGEKNKALAKQIAEIANSELFQNLVGKIQISDDIVKIMEVTRDVATKLGESLVENSVRPDAITLGGVLDFNKYRKTKTYTAIKGIGKYFGKSFMPWEAAKWTRRVAFTGNALCVAGKAATQFLEFREAVAQRERALRDARAGIRSGFNDIGADIEMHYSDITNSYIADNINSEIENIDKQFEDLECMQEAKSALYNELVCLLNETKELIKQIHLSEENCLQA